MEMAINIVAKHTVLFKDVTDVVISRHDVGMLANEHEPLGIFPPVALPEIICAHAPMPPADQTFNDAISNILTFALGAINEKMAAVKQHTIAGRVTMQHMLLMGHACTTGLATAGCRLEKRDWQAKCLFSTKGSTCSLKAISQSLQAAEM